MPLLDVASAKCNYLRPPKIVSIFTALIKWTVTSVFIIIFRPWFQKCTELGNPSVTKDFLILIPRLQSLGGSILLTANLAKQSILAHGLKLLSSESPLYLVYHWEETSAMSNTAAISNQRVKPTGADWKTFFSSGNVGILFHLATLAFFFNSVSFSVRLGLGRIVKRNEWQKTFFFLLWNEPFIFSSHHHQQ